MKYRVRVSGFPSLSATFSDLEQANEHARALREAAQFETYVEAIEVGRFSFQRTTLDLGWAP